MNLATALRTLADRVENAESHGAEVRFADLTIHLVDATLADLAADHLKLPDEREAASGTRWFDGKIDALGVAVFRPASTSCRHCGARGHHADEVIDS